MNQSAIVREINELTSAEASRDLARRIAARDDAERVLLGLVRSRDRAAMDWVVGAARPILDNGAVTVLVQLASVADPDVSDEAMSELAELSAPLPAEFIARLRTKLGSRDLHEPVTALWVAAKLRATDLIPAIEGVRDRPNAPWHSLDAEVVLELLRGNESLILERLRNHDHEYTRPLLTAAFMLRTREARDAVAACAGAATDDSCRNRCRSALGRFDEEIEREHSARRASAAGS